jgi:AcrR family transcriptional regulator
MIVAEAVSMLKEGTLAALTLRGLAKRLGVGPMSLYTHFSSRDALINGVADHVFALFEPPARHGCWQDFIRDWLWATYRHFERFPVAPKVITWDGKICSAWLKTWLPLATVLKEQGLDGDKLVFAMDWFGIAGMAYTQAQIDAPSTRSGTAFLADLEPDEQRLAIELWTGFRKIDAPSSLEFGFDHIIRGLEILVESAKTEAAPAKTAS